MNSLLSFAALGVALAQQMAPETTSFKERRMALGITLAELAAVTGYGVSTINNVENGRTTASVALLHALDDALGLRAAARLDRLREHHRWTWAEVAHALGLSVSMLMMVQRGARQLSRRAALRLLDAEIAAGLVPAGQRQVRFPGICAAAEQLGITREHAYRVLTGERQSRSLTVALARHGLKPVKRGGGR